MHHARMILQRQSGLGRGLGAIIPPKPVPTQKPAATPPPSAPASVDSTPAHTPPPAPVAAKAQPEPVKAVSTGAERMASIPSIPVIQIDRNPHQPRAHFDHAHMEDLIASIKEHGVIQPILVTKLSNGRYQLIAGERRLRAATIAGLEEIPVVIREAVDQEKLELALIENIQRQDLNPVEEAKAYLRLQEEFHLTQDDIARKVGKSRPQVANTIRLLQLPEVIQQALVDGKISASNARTLLTLSTDKERMEVFQKLVSQEFTVRQTEDQVRAPRNRRLLDPNLRAVQDALREQFRTKVDIRRNEKGSGEIRIKFGSDEELQALLRDLRESD